MKYDFSHIEKKWQKYWTENKTFKTSDDRSRAKYYILDMFPYPSGSGLHVGHPLGYIASDIYARYKRLMGFNVLHPMGFDSFGLPAEQYAIQTGQHPAKTTEKNINRYREQLQSMGFSFDWDREVRTSDPDYYRWTQWIFLKLFNSWYDKSEERARQIEDLIQLFSQGGNAEVSAVTNSKVTFSAGEWKSYTEAEKSDVLLQYRLAFLDDTTVNWCPALGTVLANDEVREGLSERGGHPVFQKKMKQWMMRITAYADRLEKGLEDLDWSESVKEMQRNWIGRSEGASISFRIKGSHKRIEVFTTRPDTLFGASFLVLSPEHSIVGEITSEEQRKEVTEYIKRTSKKTERDRISEVKSVSGVFTGSTAIHPFNEIEMPVWIADYVLPGYGTGAIMAVPSGDERDWNFARHFGLPIPQVIQGANAEEGANEDRNVRLINSSFLNDMPSDKAIQKMIAELEKKGIGHGRINYRIRDAVFSRQRYWGEPIPVFYRDGIPVVMKESELPLKLPEVDKYLPTEEGEPPLARAKNWKTKEGYPIETNTMPGWAGSSWYFFRYMDVGNEKECFSKDAVGYWKNVDFYIGGAEHATGHLLYARFWTKFLFDIGLVPEDEPFRRMLNQGMIQGKSAIIHQYNVGYIDPEDGEIKVRQTNLFLSSKLAKKVLDGVYSPGDLKKMIDDRYGKGYAQREKLISGFMNIEAPTRIHVDVSLVKGDELQVIDFQKWQPRFKDAIFLFEANEKFITESEVEKMSKTKFNVINPDDLIERYGADTLRCYEMFLGPVEQHKPWDSKGIEGVHRFLKRFWSLYHRNEEFTISDDQATDSSRKALNKFLKKVMDDIQRLSFNTGVSECMILTNQLIEEKCNQREILEPFAIAISPFAPHIAEEIWEKLGHSESISSATFPEIDEKYLIDESINYPVSFNGKVRFTMEMPSDATSPQIEEAALRHELTRKWLEGKKPKKVIVVQGKIVNIVI